MTNKTENEVMVCNCGAYWALRLRRIGTGLINLPEQYSTEHGGIEAAHSFIRGRQTSHSTEVWFCLTKVTETD